MTQTIRFIKPADLRATVRGLAIMSLLFEKTRRSRYWSDASIACDLGSWLDDKGNACWFLFAPKGTAILGFDRESPMSPHARPDEFKAYPGIYDDVSPELVQIINRKPFGENFKVEEVTFCIWNTGKGLDWKKGKFEMPKREPAGDADGAKYMIGRFKEYFDHFDHEMDEEYEKTFDPDTLFQVFSGDAVSPEDLRRIKSGIDLAEVREPLKEMGVKI